MRDEKFFAGIFDIFRYTFDDQEFCLAVLKTLLFDVRLWGGFEV